MLEINEAFASVAITSSRVLEAELDRVNPNGGAIAIGYPSSASGARILGGPLLELRRRGGGIGGPPSAPGRRREKQRWSRWPEWRGRDG